MCNGNVNLEEDDKILIFLVFEFSAQYTVCEFEFRFFFSVLSYECVEHRVICKGYLHSFTKILLKNYYFPILL